MTRASFVFSPEALEDLDDIWLYVSKDDITAADRAERKLRQAVELLAARPEIGHTRRNNLFASANNHFECEEDYFRHGDNHVAFNLYCFAAGLNRL